MKNIFGKSSIKFFFALAIGIASHQFAFAASTIKANNSLPASNALVYERDSNPAIGITPQANAVGYSFAIIDEQGKVVKSGIIKSGKTFYVTTKNLRNGNYRFTVGNYQVQEFRVK